MSSLGEISSEDIEMTKKPKKYYSPDEKAKESMEVVGGLTIKGVWTKK